MKLALRMLALAAVLFVLMGLAAVVSGVSRTAATATAASTPTVMAVAAPLVSCVLTAAVLSWLIVRSALSGARLLGAVFLAYFGLGTFMLQIESIVFLPRQLPPGFVIRLFAMGALIALFAAPAAAWLHGRFRPSPVAGTRPAGIPSTPAGWALRLAGLSAAYVALYFLAGYFIAYRNPDVVAYYGVPLMIGAALSVWLVLLLAPNPYMPESVRMSHLVETASSNFVFGCIVGAAFARAR